MGVWVSVSRVALRLSNQCEGLTLRNARDRLYYQIYHSADPVIDPLVDAKKLGGRLYLRQEAAEKLLQGESVI